NGRRQCADPLADGDGHALTFGLAALGQHLDEQNRHQKILKEGGIPSTLAHAKLPDECILNAKRGPQSQHAPRGKAVGTLITGKVSPSELEIRVENAHVQDKPTRVDNRLQAGAGTKSVNGVNQLPGNVQCKRVVRNCIGSIADSDTYAFDINDGPAYSADEGEDDFCRFDRSHVSLFSVSHGLMAGDKHVPAKSECCDLIA